MSAPVVAIGYIVLIPSILGILFSLILLFATGHTGSTTAAAIRESATSTLQQSHVPETIIQKVVSSQQLTDEDEAILTRAQKTAVEATRSSLHVAQAGAGAGTAIAGGISIFVGIASFVSGLLGWLLVMKKKVLRCKNCGAIVQAA